MKIGDIIVPAGQSHSSNSCGGSRRLLSVLLPLRLMLHVAVTEQPDIVGVRGLVLTALPFTKHCFLMSDVSIMESGALLLGVVDL